MNTTVYPLALTQNGWVKNDECKCGGIHKVKFINAKYPNYVVEWWVKYYAFRVTKSNSTVQPQTSLKQLQGWLVTFAAEQDALNGTKAKQVVKTPLKTTAKAEPVKVEPKADFAPIEAKADDPVKAEDIELNKTPKKTPKK